MASKGSVAGAEKQLIILKQLNFKDPGFRKLRNVTLKFSSRITLITGHNGVGKSTILGMLASTSGLTKTTPYRSYFGKFYEANVSEIVFIDHKTEVEDKKADSTLSEPIVTFSVAGKEVSKSCSLTRRGSAQRARIVSRTIPRSDFSHAGISFGPDAKLPLPTIFLGMARMLPIGESPDSRVQNTTPIKWDLADQNFLVDFVNNIIPGANAVSGAVTANRVKLTTKVSSHPKYSHDVRSVSLGQDSLGAIATAIASFHRLKRVQKTKYRGGLLIIDELDAGFHPHALKKLIAALRQAADDLHLQIVATSHSPGLIKSIHPEGPFAKVARNKDSVVYLRNTSAPKHDPSFDLEAILNDMELTPPAIDPPPPILQVYFEDDEAMEMFARITAVEKLKAIGSKYGVTISPMPLGIGCSSLERLPSKDPYFKSVLLVLDADGKPSTNTPENAIFLPGGADSIGNGLSPERTMIQFIRDIIEREADYQEIWESPKVSRMSTDNMRETFVGDPSIDIGMDRKMAKTWWREHIKQLDNLNLIQHWAKANELAINEYMERLDVAVRVAAKEKRKLTRIAASLPTK